jgi:hypothetical protein
MKLFVAAALLVGLASGGCGSGTDNANSAGPMCRLTGSPNACQRCWAVQCPSQLDYCYGAGFHNGELVAGNATSSAAPCARFSTCLQTCGCFDSCFDSCIGELTNGCRDCQEKYFAACRDEKCAAACSPADGGS